LPSDDVRNRQQAETLQSGDSHSLERERERTSRYALFCRTIEVWAGAESLSTVLERVALERAANSLSLSGVGGRSAVEAAADRYVRVGGTTQAVEAGEVSSSSRES